MQKKHVAVDAAMLLLLPLLMAYSLIGEHFHEFAGTLMLVLFITHHCLNRRWGSAIGKGRYTARRVFQTVLNGLLFLFMIFQPLCGILMSKHVYTFLPTEGLSAAARAIHLPLAHWGFTLMCLHTGTHMRPIVKRLPHWSLPVILMISAYGAYAFIKRHFLDYMLMRIAFVFYDYGEPVLFFVLDVIAMMLLLFTLGYLADSMLVGGQKQRKRRKEIENE